MVGYANHVGEVSRFQLVEHICRETFMFFRDQWLPYTYPMLIMVKYALLNAFVMDYHLRWLDVVCAGPIKWTLGKVYISPYLDNQSEFGLTPSSLILPCRGSCNIPEFFTSIRALSSRDFSLVKNGAKLET